jgi:glucose/arabinose dehydrogenase
MNDARRFRMNAAECLLAAKTCEPPYRGLILAVATSWHALARQDEAIDELIESWSMADSAALVATVPRKVPARAGAGVSSANRIMRSANEVDNQQTKANVFFHGLNSPFGTTLAGNDLFIDNTDAILRFPTPRVTVKYIPQIARTLQSR